MNLSLSCIVYWLLIFSCNNGSKHSQKIPNNDTIFINWNKATLQSLTKQTKSAKDSIEKNLLENRILAFKALIDIHTEDDAIINSIRYRFIQKIISADNIQKKFYVIEANRSGELVEIRN
jgi:hypothetical protein